MKSCIIIGGGFSGLSSAAYLSGSGFKITLLESSPKLGGRAYSLKDDETGSVIDNGQHILMGCYNYTLDFFKLIGAEKNLIAQERLKIIFLKEDFKHYPLAAPGVPYPLNLLFALLGYKAFSAEDKLRLLSFFSKLPLYSGKDLEKMTVDEWLHKENQSENASLSFWDILVAGALNTDKKKASAKVLADILKQIFFGGNKAATVIMPKYGLSETYCSDAENYIISKGGEIRCGETVNQLKSSGTKISEIVTSRGTLKDFDFVISSVPLFAFNRIDMAEKFKIDLDLEYSPILTVHFWIKENPLKESFYGLIGSPVHWIFNRGDHITIVISNAGYLMNEPKDRLFDLTADEIQKYLPIKKIDILSYKIIKEKRATFIASCAVNKKRPSPETIFNNFFLAGDWTNTGLPSTIEGAVKSGKTAADIVISKSRN